MKTELKSIEEIEKHVTDLVCFCHLRWNFVYQRPQHLISRFSRKYRTFFIEEPIMHAGKDGYETEQCNEVCIIRPLLNEVIKDQQDAGNRQKQIINQIFQDFQINSFIAWYYTPMALKISNQLKPALTVYDCMDELSAFKFAPQDLKIQEATLFKQAQIAFTGGHHLYQAKKHVHKNIHPFPSSIDKAHFAQARQKTTEPEDQQHIPPVRLGFYGVIDERFNIKLIEEIATKRPEWQIVLIGPVVKIDEATLPRMDNIHYLGCKSYNDLPAYLSGWDIALIPFEKNESTEYISPTKTPEYLAGGKPVISTSIADVVNPYGKQNIVHIADTADDFIASAEIELRRSPASYTNWLEKVDMLLSNNCWDDTADRMMSHLTDCIAEKQNSLSSSKWKSVA